MERILFLVLGRIKRDEMTIRDLGFLSAQGRKIWNGMEWKAKFELNGTRKGEVYMGSVYERPGTSIKKAGW